MRRVPVLCLWLLYVGVDGGSALIQADDFLQARERCLRRGNISDEYRQRFDRFQFANEPIVHDYLYCLSIELRVWRDATGFDALAVAQMYGDHADEEALAPTVGRCNQSEYHKTARIWCYKAYMCILRSPMGQWYKTKTSDIINGNYRS